MHQSRIVFLLLVGLSIGSLCAVAPAAAQRIVTQPEEVIAVSKGTSALLVNPTPIPRFSVGDPSVAEVVVLSPTEVLINGKSLGTTTLFVWDNSGRVRVYSVEVTVDAAALERYIRSALPGETISVSASGNSVTLSGTVTDPNSVARAVEIAITAGATVIDNLVAPPAVQVMLQVRFAEVNRTAFREFSTRLRLVNPDAINGNTPTDWSSQVVGGDGTIDFLLEQGTAQVEAFIKMLQKRGDFRSLAEPNLMTLPGQEAYFLAGGRFPFPTVQSGGAAATNAVTVTFEEFGVKLRFTPTIARNGSIRLKLQPEVSSLDFANGLVISGFEIPTILTRKAETEVELREGQYLAIAGLLDNQTINNVSKIPILGDIPILGHLFRSKDMNQRRTELLVLITPKLVSATNRPPVLPTGEPSTWRWDGTLKHPAGPPEP